MCDIQLELSTIISLPKTNSARMSGTRIAYSNLLATCCLRQSETYCNKQKIMQYFYLIIITKIVNNSNIGQRYIGQVNGKGTSRCGADRRQPLFRSEQRSSTRAMLELMLQRCVCLSSVSLSSVRNVVWLNGAS